MYKSPKIAIIICYMGRFPWYFKYFLFSCKYNPTIDFFIISDQPIEKKLYGANIKFIYYTLKDIENLASKKLGFEIEIKQPYKLCDFKPAYGYLFHDILSGYEFWGHSDIDVIYGNMRNFLTEDVLSDYDIISVRHEYLTGFFALYRNSIQINSLFQKSKDYRLIFTKDEYCGFDECSNLCMDLINGFPLETLQADFESMTHVVKNKKSELNIRPYFDFHVVEGIPGDLKWDNGTLTYKNRYEIILYHLIDFKKNQNLLIPTFKRLPSTFYINKTSISA